MTAAMLLMHRRLPWWQRYALPPRQITRTMARKAGIAHKLAHEDITALTTAAHFGYGAVAGIPYSVLVEPMPAPAAVKGATYGLAVWAVSYLELLPGLRILYPATRHPRERNLLMIAAHLVWGATLGIVSQRLRRRSDQNSTPKLVAPAAVHRPSRPPVAANR